MFVVGASGELRPISMADSRVEEGDCSRRPHPRPFAHRQLGRGPPGARGRKPSAVDGVSIRLPAHRARPRTAPHRPTLRDRLLQYRVRAGPRLRRQSGAPPTVRPPPRGPNARRCAFGDAGVRPARRPRLPCSPMPPSRPSPSVPPHRGGALAVPGIGPGRSPLRPGLLHCRTLREGRLQVKKYFCRRDRCKSCVNRPGRGREAGHRAKGVGLWSFSGIPGGGLRPTGAPSLLPRDRGNAPAVPSLS